MLNKTRCLLAAAILCGYACFAAGAFAAGPAYTYNYRIYGGSVSGNGQLGPARMAGTIPVITPNRRYVYTPRNRRWNAPTQFQRRYSGGSDYANLNQ